MSFVSLDEFKVYMRDQLGAASDADMTTALAAGHQLVNEMCAREFVVASTASARVFVPDSSDLLRIDDCTTVTVVSDNGTTITSTDYQLEPLNSRGPGGVTVPYDQIRRTSGSWYRDGRKATVSITATWGWSAIPDAIVEAVKILSKDVVDHRNVRGGMLSTMDGSGVARMRQASLVGDLIAPYKRVEAWGVA